MNAVLLPATLQEQYNGYYYNENGNNSYDVVDNLILSILLAQLVTPLKFAVLGLALGIVITVISNRLIPLTDQKIRTKAIAATRCLTGGVAARLLTRGQV
jgi:hypothetical protein